MNKKELQERLAALPHPGRARGNVNDTFWCVNGVLGANSMDPTKPAWIRHGKMRCANGSYEEWRRHA